jgi:hypothetical protein
VLRFRRNIVVTPGSEWSGGTSGSAQAVTDASGQCTFESESLLKRNGTATLTVTGVSHTDYAYDATANHDPDGDSDGTSITVSK